MTGLRFEHYDWKGGREAMLRFGPDTGPIVIAALPLFEEANRTRHFLVTILRALALRGIGSVLPDFPGTGDSLIATNDATTFQMREAYEALVDLLSVDRSVYAVGIRSGALLDTFGLIGGRWHLSPHAGEEVLRELWRTKHATSGSASRFDLHQMIGGPPEDNEYAGNLLSEAMLADLCCVSPFTAEQDPRLRIVRLETDPRAADVKFPGTPLWRRAEPGTDSELAQMLAIDIAAWITACES